VLVGADLDGTNQHPGYNPDNDATARHRNSVAAEEEAPTASIPVAKE
jgi:hypothetical protein